MIKMNKSFHWFFNHYRENLVLAPIIFAVFSYGAVEFWATTILSVYAAVLLLFVLFQNRNTQPIHYRINYIDGFFLLFLLLEIGSLFYTASFYTTKISLLKNTSYFILFYYTISQIKSREQILYLIHALVIFGIVYATVALTVIGLDILGVRNFSSNEHITLTFVNRNHFAGFLELLVFPGVGLSLFYNKSRRILFLVLSAYMAGAIFFSLSRGGIIGFGAGTIFLMSLLLFFERHNKSWITISTFVLLILLLLIILGIDPIIERFETLENPQLAGIGRLEYWKGSLAMIQNYPIFGTGLGTYSTVFPIYQTSYVNQLFVTHAHNDYLELAAETGIPGFTIFALMILSFFIVIIKLSKSQHDRGLKIIAISILSSILSLSIHSFTDFNFHIPSNVILFAVLGAIAFNAASGENSAIHFKLIHLSSLQIRIFRIALSVVALSIIVLSVSSFTGYNYLRKAQKLKQKKEYPEAILMLTKARFFDSNNPQVYAELGDIYWFQAQSSLDNVLKDSLKAQSLDQYEHAISRVSVQSYYYTRKAFILQDLQKYDESIFMFRKAKDLMPTKAYTRFNLANALYANKNIDEAKNEYKQSLLISDEFLNSSLNAFQKHQLSCEEISNLLPDKASSRSQFARRLSSQKDFKHAIIEWWKVYNLQPDDNNAIQLTNAMIGAQNNTMAIHILDSLVRKNNSSVLQNRYVDVLIREKDYQNAIQSAIHFMAKSPDNLSLQLSLAKAYELTKQSVLADSTYRHVLSRFSEYSETHQVYASFLMSQDLHEQAISHLKRAIDLKPNNYVYFYQLGMVYKKLKLYDLALEKFNQSIGLNPKHTASAKEIEHIKLILKI